MVRYALFFSGTLAALSNRHNSQCQAFLAQQTAVKFNTCSDLPVANFPEPEVDAMKNKITSVLVGIRTGEEQLCMPWNTAATAA